MANIDAWHDVARERGLRVRTVPFDQATGQLCWDMLESFVSQHTVLIAIGAASNALGTINDVPRITALAKSAGALSFIDAVHYAPHVLADVQALDCDFLVCSPYKFYGPHLGVLYGRNELLSRLDVTKVAPAPSQAPENLETGTLSHEAIMGAAAAVDFLASVEPRAARRDSLEASYAVLHERASRQVLRLWNSLSMLKGVTCYGPPPDVPRTPTVSFTVRGYSSEEVCRRLGRQGLFLSHGDFYAKTVVDRLDIEGLVRAGCACYTTNSEITRLISAITELSET